MRVRHLEQPLRRRIPVERVDVVTRHRRERIGIRRVVGGRRQVELGIDRGRRVIVPDVKIPIDQECVPGALLGARNAPVLLEGERVGIEPRDLNVPAARCRIENVKQIARVGVEADIRISAPLPIALVVIPGSGEGGRADDLPVRSAHLHHRIGVVDVVVDEPIERRVVRPLVLVREVDRRCIDVAHEIRNICVFQYLRTDIAGMPVDLSRNRIREQVILRAASNDIVGLRAIEWRNAAGRARPIEARLPSWTGDAASATMRRIRERVDFATIARIVVAIGVVGVAGETARAARACRH